MSSFFTYLGIFVVALPVFLAIALLGTMWRAWWLYPAFYEGYWVRSKEAAAIKCDGTHAGPRCADPECWNQ